MVHGVYDLIAFMTPKKIEYVAWILMFAIVVATFLYVRSQILVVFEAFPLEVNVHKKVKNGEIHPPKLLCINAYDCSSLYLK